MRLSILDPGLPGGGRRSPRSCAGSPPSTPRPGLRQGDRRLRRRLDATAPRAGRARRRRRSSRSGWSATTQNQRQGRGDPHRARARHRRLRADPGRRPRVRGRPTTRRSSPRSSSGADVVYGSPLPDQRRGRGDAHPRTIVANRILTVTANLLYGRRHHRRGDLLQGVPHRPPARRSPSTCERLRVLPRGHRQARASARSRSSRCRSRYTRARRRGGQEGPLDRRRRGDVGAAQATRVTRSSPSCGRLLGEDAWRGARARPATPPSRWPRSSWSSPWRSPSGAGAARRRRSGSSPSTPPWSPCSGWSSPRSCALVLRR